MERKREAATLKKTYQPPKLQIYGSLSEMTKKHAGTSDHGGNAMST